jgi:hypothetical protein
MVDHGSSYSTGNWKLEIGVGLECGRVAVERTVEQCYSRVCSTQHTTKGLWTLLSTVVLNHSRQVTQVAVAVHKLHNVVWSRVAT